MMHPKTASLLERPQWVQRSPEWYAVRRDMITASEAASALGHKPFPSYAGSPRNELMARKLSDAPLNSVFAAHGVKYEDEARRWAAAALGETILDVGLVRHPTLDWLGASPDGVTLTGKLVEIKCPLKRAVKPGQVPSHYYPQVQVQMEVADVDSTIFVEYKPASLSDDMRTATLSIVVVERDRAWFERSMPTLRAFWDEYSARRKDPLGKRGLPAVDEGRCSVIDGMYDDMDVPAGAAADAAADVPADAAADVPADVPAGAAADVPAGAVTVDRVAADAA